jgi:hypothetical protein
MTLAERTVLVTISAGITLGVLWGVRAFWSPSDVTMPAEPAPVHANPAGIKGLPLGTAGCLGAACHGAPAGATLAGKIDDGTWQSSGSCWVAADPHTAAYSLLTDRPHRPVRVTADHIMERYAPGTKATDDARCLACHSNPALAEPEPSADPAAVARRVAMRAEGVNCESCHGNAGGWLHTHTTWKGDRSKVYEEAGMTKLYDVGERALACAGCHVGAPAENGLAVRDMNHDMIAAGHPRLNFDFAEYLRRLPVHWQEKDRTATGNVPRGPEFPAKAYLVGRVAHAEAACKLLASRAERAERQDARTPWAEFSEFNCASCHHNLPAPWRENPTVLGKRPLGVPPWQAIWPVTPAIGLNPPRPAVLFAGAGVNPGPAVDTLVGAMETPRPARAAKVLPLATAASGELTKLRIELSRRPDAEFVSPLEKLFGTLNADAADLDTGVQVYFGLSALERARPRGATPNPAFRAAAEAYRSSTLSDTARWEKFRPALETLLAERAKK